MGTLYLIRHGQASAHALDYDQLSGKGKEQSSMIGRFFSNHSIDAIYIGPRKRHLQTYEMAKQEHWPMPIQAYWLDEFPAHDLMRKGLDISAEFMPELIEDIVQIKQQVGSSGRSYHKVLQKITQLWIDGMIDIEDVERFEEYKQRILLAKRSLCVPRDGTILCFSSAGFIASLMGVIQESDDWQALRSAWALYNGSFSTFHLSKDGPLLSSFNWMEHIPKDMRTFL